MSAIEKTLLILTPGFPASEDDTTCIPAQQTFVRTLKRCNPTLNIIVVAFQYPFRFDDYDFHSVRVISLNGGNKRRLNKLLTWLNAWRIVTRINSEHNVIGVLSFWLGECALVGKYFARKYNLKQFTWLLGQDAKQGNPYYSIVQPTSHSLIALSDFVVAEFYKNYRVTPQHIIPVGIDTSMFVNNELIRDIDILGAGSLIPLKRYDLFIEIIKDLSGDIPLGICIIVGKGPEKKKLQTKIHDSGLQEIVKLFDELPHTDVLRLMERSKIFLHTSSYEGYGAVCSEALYAGAHVVSFCKPMDEDFTHEYFVRSKEEAISKIKQILTDTRREHHRVLAYSAESVAEQVMKLFIK
jgi:glycosyltransferase involved in cell wall biosynthesis